MGRSDFAERRLSWVENSPAEFDIPQGRRALRGYTRALSKRPVTARMRRFRFIAWLTLFATLYSAASPTLAAVFFADTPAVLGQLLGIPAAAANSTAADQCASHSEHHAAPAQTNPSPGAPQPAHAAHGIYCSFCLNPSSIATIAAAPVALSVLSLAVDVAPPESPARLFSSSFPLYRSRAPPVAG